ncbi:MAG: helix-turn-helix transcriptional regulator [Lachnospiraceae bacterium]|nr:helix-turn-helix transcriptional regulator [Lachnospiraceae bacterium]
MDKRECDAVAAERLRKLRLSKNMTQEQMAEAIGISESLYKGNESGRLPISRKTAQLIENSFGVSFDYMFFGTLRDSKDIWTEILECDENEKMRIMLRLIKYFSLQGDFDFTEKMVEDIIKIIRDNN